MLEQVTPNTNATTSENSVVAHHPLKISQPETCTCTLKLLIFNATQCFTFVLYLCRRNSKKRQHSARIDCIDKFIDYQRAAKSKFLEWEERRQKREDVEAMRRREEREHELRLFRLLAGTQFITYLSNL